jgi:hypothetical protein
MKGVELYGRVRREVYVEGMSRRKAEFRGRYTDGAAERLQRAFGSRFR